MTFRKWCHDRLGVWWHAQNLSDHGPMWRSGRAWLYWSPGIADTGRGYRTMLEVNPEWNVQPRNSAGIGIQLGGGDGNTDVQLNLDLALARFYLTFDSPLWRPWLDRILPGHWFAPPDTQRQQGRNYPIKITEETEIAIRWFEGGLRWSFWHPTMEWSSRTPKWRNGHFDPADFLLGRHKYSSEELSTENVEVPMPEKTYAGTVTLTRDTWKRPRWPFSRSIYRANIEVEGGVPHPGKGENSWDCGEDATYGMTCPARTAEQAVGKLVESVLSSRRRYGGRKWRPQEPVAV